MCRRRFNCAMGPTQTHQRRCIMGKGFVCCSALRAIAFLMAALLLSRSASGAGSSSILITADTEGHAGPCRECPLHEGLGGLVRRATMLTKARNGNNGVLLIDAGNALFGPDSIASNGKVIVEA